MTLPTLQVLLDDGTGTFPYDITQWVLFANGYSFSRGREDWQAAVTAGSLSSLTLNNSDGRFSPGSTIIASPSPIKVDQRIRLKETVSGVTFTRITGYIKSLPVGWPATVSTFSTVTITATDAQARAERRILRSVIEEEILSDGPDAYYTLGEPAGATTAADTSGNQAPMLTMAGSGTDVVFGNATGPGTDGLTAAEFAGGKYLWDPTFAYAATPAFIIAFATTSSAVQGIIPGLSMNAGTLVVSATSVGTGVYNDGLIHVVAIRYTAATTADVYIDGALSNSGVAVAALSGVTGFGVGGPFAGGSASFTGSIAHAPVFNTAPSGARLITMSQAMLTGWDPAFTVADVVNQVLGWVGESATTTGTFTTIPAFADITGKSMWGLLSELADDAEGGLLYVGGDGAVTLNSRTVVGLKTTPDLSIDKQFVTADVLPTLDDQRILNHLETTAQGTGVTQLVNNAASETAHGRYPDSKTYLVQTDAEALDRGNWIVTNFAEPATRYGTLTIDLYRMTAAQAQAALAAVDVDAWVRVTNFPSQTPGGTTVDVVVQGFTEEVTETTWRLQCNVVSRSLFNVGIFDDATYGVFDSTVARFGV